MTVEGIYSVYLGQESVGRVAVSRQGLYYHFLCKCELLSGMFQLMAGSQSLGLLVPEKDQLVLSTMVPVKRIGQKCPRFTLQPRHQPMPQSFVPLSPQEPFAYLRRLENAYLATQNGQLGVVLEKQDG